MKDRLHKIMEAEGLSPAKFADEIGVQRSSISHIISGRNKPSYDFIIKILNRFKGINAEWLLTGNGNMIKGKDMSVIEGKTANSLFDLGTDSTGIEIKGDQISGGSISGEKEQNIKHQKKKEYSEQQKVKNIYWFFMRMEVSSSIIPGSRLFV